MPNQPLYTSGQFAKKAHVSIRTIRYYDQQNILKPSWVSEAGARHYTDADFARLQQILLLKYLGFSLEDIREMTIDDTDQHMMINSLNMQLKLVRDKIEQMQMVEKAIVDTTQLLKDSAVNTANPSSDSSNGSSSDASVDAAGNMTNWSKMLDLIHLTNMETSLKTQYQNANNISARIQLHRLYSTNKEGWFPWLFAQCGITAGMTILDVGCGNGAFWLENIHLIPDNCTILLTDISAGMLRDTRRNFEPHKQELAKRSISIIFKTFDCTKFPYKIGEKIGDKTGSNPNDEKPFDLILANHVLFYCDQLDKTLSGLSSLLKKNGRLVASTYSANHMKEISALASAFDDRIVLSADKLYDIFGLENGADQLATFFSQVQQHIYPDSLNVTDPQPLVEYILSCHGNQNQYLIDRYKDFRSFITKKVGNSYTITKEAGVFICEK